MPEDKLHFEDFAGDQLASHSTQVIAPDIRAAI
jgi:hypothetical protein